LRDETEETVKHVASNMVRFKSSASTFKTEYKSPRLRDLDFHRSVIHLPRRRQILQFVFKY